MSKTIRRKNRKLTNRYGFLNSMRNWEDFGVETAYLKKFQFSEEIYDNYIHSDRHKKFKTRNLKVVKKESNVRTRNESKMISKNVMTCNNINEFDDSGNFSNHKKNKLMFMWCL